MRIRLLPLLRALSLFGTPALFADDAYVGAQTCGSCHAAQLRGQSASGHARALHRATEHPLSASFTPAEVFVRPPNFHIQFVRTAQGIQARADDSRILIRLPVDWAFGAGVHAVTFVGKASDELYLEHSFTYYTDSRSFDLTPKHETLPANTVHEAIGQAIRTQGSGFTIQTCFQCHSTGPVFVSAKHEVQITEPGVRCEVCHGPGNAHVQAVRGGNVALARKRVQNPKTLTAGELNRMCGTCHRFPDGSRRAVDWSDPWNVRHQPPYLQESRCFQKTGGGLSCLTCHNPHETLRRNDAPYYRQICMRCHGGNAPRPNAICMKVETSDCTGCHMPAVAANSHLQFRNHWIGVYAAGTALKPRR